MPNYGFAIDLRKCIGCHACTIACKAEHQIPVGVNRCWVKTVEKGTFPDTRRFFFPVLCNQCDDAPCVRICPTNALFKRRDGIVDLHGDVVHRLPRLHGGVPVRSAVHRSEHAHRREVQLLREPRREPAAAGVRQRLPDRVPHLRRPRRSGERGRADRAARGVHGPQAGEGHRCRRSSTSAPTRARSSPEIADAAVHLQGRPGAAAAARRADAGSATTRATPRVDYDMPHGKPWGLDMALYLLTKGIATGAMLLSRAAAGGSAIASALADASSARRSRSCSSSLTAVAARRRSRAARALLLHPRCARTGDRGWCGARTS